MSASFLTQTLRHQAFRPSSDSSKKMPHFARRGIALFATLLPSLASQAADAPNATRARPDFPDVPAGQTRSDKALKGGKMSYWGVLPDQAKPMTATFLGGKGHEWLCAGGFQPDGTIVLAGNVNGGEFEMTVKESVLGHDGTRPAPAEFKTTTEKDGKPVTEVPTWTRPDTTGFLIFTTPDLQTVTKIVRLPWTSAAITGMVVGKAGEIYLAGKPGPSLANLGGRQETLSIPDDPERKGSLADAAFIAKLSKDGSTVEWLYFAPGKTDAPMLSLLDNGNITFGAQDLRVFDPSGKQVSVTAVPGGVRETTAVNPADGTVVTGGERNTSTGREPWRCPILRVLEPDGTLRYQLYEWPSRYVVLDNIRAVSDTAVRGVTFDKEGNLLVKLWSDGGNSVATAQPTDLRTGPPNNGLGLNAAGANATSFAYLAKIDPKDYHLLGWTMWTTRYAGKANGAKIDAVGFGDDGSVLFSGSASWGLIQTSNKLANGEPGGPYIAVTTPDMTGMRFCSAVPGLDAADLGNNRERIAIGHGTVNGHARALFLGGATAEGEAYGLTTKTPTLNAIQPAFGGGLSDGYVVMLDLPAGSANSPKPEREPRRLTIANEGSSPQKKPEPSKGEPLTATEFEFSPTLPKWNHADAEFRVADGSYWPSFIAGRPETGRVTWAETGCSGSFQVTLDLFAQDKGRQDRRVLGQFYQGDEPPKVSFSVASFGTQTTGTWSVPDKKGTPQQRSAEFQPLNATLTIGETTAKIPFQAVSKRGRVVESPMQRLNVSAYATVKGSVIGLKGDLANKDIDIRITTQGVDPSTASGNPRKN